MFSQVFVCPRGVSVRGVSVGGALPRGVSVQGGISVQGGLFPGGSVKETPRTENPPYGKERAVHILLECILVIFFVSLLWCHSINFQKRNTLSHEFRTLIHRSPFYIFTAHQRSYGKVVCLVMSVYHSVHGGIPCDHYPSCIEFHCTGIPHPGPSLPPLDMGPYWAETPSALSPARDIWWPRLETHWNLFTSGPPQQCWHLVVIKAHTIGASSQYASYWKSFFLVIHSVLKF